MLVKFFDNSFYFITVTVLVSGCSGNKAPVFEENRINVNKKFQEKKNSSRGSLKDFSDNELISQKSSSFLLRMLVSFYLLTKPMKISVKASSME